ncbi:hypothetical protein AMS68_007571 [Peltaster fructicola]|uniref:DFDF domain-containing protein n=1 Tax=Peltaster fructicola TaxID=286661 RepID=A0A6H0Y4W1_9PEZI|nr:hypothetical protein AMS68_007571 [Peltaster fructicola]
MSEYIGSRIALISKSDIKYIGTLHEINSESSTVALENVRSHGTEGRRHGQEEVPPSDTVYEYIVFRGSDVKELSIVEAPKENKPPAAVPNDPAILGSARPPQYQQGPPQPPHNQFPAPHQYPPYDFQQGPPPQYPPPRFGGPGGPHGFPGQPGAVPGYNPGFGPPPPPNFPMGYGPPPGAFGQHPPPGQFSPAPQNPIAPPGQRPPQKQEVPPQRAQKPAEMSGTPAPAAVNSQAPPPQSNPKPSVAQSAATAAAIPEKPAAKKAPNNRVAVPLPTAKSTQKPAAQKEVPQTYADATQAATAAVAEAMAKLSTTAQPQSDLGFRDSQPRPQDGTRGRGRGRSTAAPRGARGGRAAVEVPKEDFDFAESNAKFNKQDLVKEAIASGSPLASPPANGENANAFENGEEDVIIPPKPAEKGYNKQTSFFDDISSDLKDRSASTAFDGRAMRRDERNKNVETFGQGSVDSGHRGGYRGRGRGRGRGQALYRGGLDGTRGGGNARPRGPADIAAALAASS